MTDPALSTSERAAIDALLQPFACSDAPGLVIGIARRGTPICRLGLGLASIGHAVANTPRTRMRIGSTSKHFTALAVLLLAERGLLSPDDPVRRHLPELPSLADPEPTLRQLMNHTSGWRCHVALHGISSGTAMQPPGAALALLSRQGELNFEPGRQMAYCNGGYHLLGKVIERVSGMDLGRFLATHVFEPVGMPDTEVLASDLEIRPGIATLHQALPPVDGQPRWRRGIFPSEELGGEGAMVSTIADMLRWLAHLRSDDRRVGSAQSWSQMTAPTTLASGTVLPYGLGLLRERHRGVEVIHHAGGVIGGAAQMITVPAEALDIVVMTNGAPVAPAALCLRIIDILLADRLSEPPEARVSAARFPALAGHRYHAPSTGAVLGFAEVDGQLALSWLGYQPVPLREQGAWLWLGVADLHVSPLRIEASALAGRVAPAGFVLSEGGVAHRFERLPDAGPPIESFAPELVGHYAVPDLDAQASIAFDGVALTLTVRAARGRLDARLTPLSNDVMACVPTDPLLVTMGAGCVINIDRQRGRVVSLRLDLLRIRHLRFLRLGETP